MSVYEKSYRLLSSDVDAGQRLRLSRLFTFLQEASIAHTTLLGMGREKTLDRGLLWIVTLQQVKVDRLPVYDEDVKLLSWPGATMHLYFPRYYRMEDKDGRTLLTGSAHWALLDRENRKMVFPEEHGVRIDGETGEGPLPLLAAPKPAREGEKETFAVPYSYVDLNGHMNNTRYLDLAEDRMPADLRQRAVREIRAEYSGEAKLGESMDLTYTREGDAFLLSGDRGRKLFRLNLMY
ncbi:MAG: hypothetical protein IJC00_07540 [Clostridia bacterium]|nr:hypothetical protein [Clostridia bacterium]